MIEKRSSRLGKKLTRLFDRVANQFADVLVERLREALREQFEHSWHLKEAESPSPVVRLDVPDAIRQLGGAESKQYLNQFFSMNHRWIALLAERNRRTAVGTYDFIDREMGGALFILDQMKLVQFKFDEIPEGHVLDLGVYKGSSTRSLSRIFPDRIIHGFDSFEGLPDDWEHVLKGEFGDLKGELPKVPHNVVLHKGWFNETLPEWVLAYPGEPIALLRVDCDVYSSTQTIFDTVGHLLRPGSWILFDELIGYRGWQEHEYRAFTEFVERVGLEFHFIGYGLTYTAVVIDELNVP